MSASIILALLFGSLFLLSFFTRRRYGLLGLAFAAGMLISEYAMSLLRSFLVDQGPLGGAVPMDWAVRLVLLTVPVLLVLLNGPTIKGRWVKFVGSLLFASFGVTLLLPFVAALVTFDDLAAMIALRVQEFKPVIIIACTAIAVLDTFFLKMPKATKPRSHDKHDH